MTGIEVRAERNAGCKVAIVAITGDLGISGLGFCRDLLT